MSWTLTSIVPSETVPAALRLKDDDDLDVVERAGGGVAGRRVGRQPVGAGEGRGVGVALQLRLQRLDFVSYFALSASRRRWRRRAWS